MIGAEVSLDSIAYTNERRRIQARACTTTIMDGMHAMLILLIILQPQLEAALSFSAHGCPIPCVRAVLTFHVVPPPSMPSRYMAHDPRMVCLCVLYGVTRVKL